MNRYEIYWVDGSHDTFKCEYKAVVLDGFFVMGTDDGELIRINPSQVKMISSRSLDEEVNGDA